MCASGLVLSLPFLGVPAAGDPPPAALAHELRADPDDPLRAYAWDDGEATPAVFRTPAVRLDWGEAGLTRETRLYLPLNEGSGPCAQDVAAAVGDGVQLGPGTAWCRGRFGAALELERGDAVLALDAGAGVLAPPWTLELWVRPGDAAGALIEAPGAFTLAVEADGTCVFALEPARSGALEQAPFTLRSAGRLRPDAWNHVAVAYDDVPDLEHVRLLVNGELAGGVRTPGTRLGAARGLRLGHGWVGALDDVRVIGRAAMTAELIERHAAEPPPGETLLRLDYADRVETVSLWRDVLAVPVVDGVELFGAGELRQVVAARDGLRWVPAHWERDRAASPPMARTTHPTVSVGGGLVFVFGGETRDTHFHDWHNTNDTWLYDTRARAWERVETVEAPPPTCHQGAAYSPDLDAVLYFGGARNDRGAEPIVFGDTWLFHVGERRWERLVTLGEAPVGAGCGVVWFPPLRSFVAVRGRHVSLFVPASRTWVHLPPARMVDAAGAPFESGESSASGESGAEGDPGFGGSMMLAYDPSTRRIVLFGGEVFDAGGGEFFDRTGWLHVPSNTITLRATDPHPSARVRSGFSYDPVREQLVLFGGVLGQFERRFDDLWTYRSSEDRWARIEASNAPSARGGYYGMAWEPEADAFFLLCGRHAPTRFLNDAWRLLLRPDEPGSADFVFEGAALPSDARWFVDWSGPPGSTVTSCFRASADGTSWSDWTDEPDTTARRVGVRLELRPDAEGASPEVRAFGFR